MTTLVDGSEYFTAMKAAMENAQTSILLLGWDFDPRVRFEGNDGDAPREMFHELMQRLLSQSTTLQVHILIWDMVLAFAMQCRVGPQKAGRWISHDRLHYRLDSNIPRGAAHHQKILVIDDSIAFCGGSDFTRNRWDTQAHLPGDSRRRIRDGTIYGPRHDVVMAVDGPAAQALGDLARERWARATGVRIEFPAKSASAWPKYLEPDIEDVPVAIARTEPAMERRAEIREIEALYLVAIASANRWIYIENHYFTSASIGAALARRLEEPGGPEVIAICPLHSGGVFDRLAMDHARNDLIHRLHQADRYGRFKAFSPIADEDVAITVHSKVMIVDDRMLRVGSANLNNRSLGFDTECDLAIEAADSSSGPVNLAILRMLLRLLAEHMNSSVDVVGQRIVRLGSLLACIDELNAKQGRRLRELVVDRPGLLDRLFGATHIFDQWGTADNWCPWRRVGPSIGASIPEEP